MRSILLVLVVLMSACAANPAPELDWRTRDFVVTPVFTEGDAYLWEIDVRRVPPNGGSIHVTTIPDGGVSIGGQRTYGPGEFGETRITWLPQGTPESYRIVFLEDETQIETLIARGP